MKKRSLFFLILGLAMAACNSSRVDQPQGKAVVDTVAPDTAIDNSQISQKRVTLIYSGKRKKIRDAVDRANEILSDPSFYEAIRKIKGFDNTGLNGAEIAAIMENSSQEIRITVLPKPLANASTESSNEIKVSLFRFSRNLADGVNTLIHETVHAVDFLDGNGNNFNHASNNNRDGKQDNTAPWVIGAIAEGMVK